MSTDPGAAAPGDGTPAGEGGQGGTPPSWYQGDAFKALPPDSHGWLQRFKAPEEAIVAGWNAVKHVGVPPDRLLKLPEKPDDPAWGEIRARVGWKAPEKPEDYGIAVPDGYPTEYATAIASEAHKLGIPKDAMAGLVAANQRFVEAAQQAHDAKVRAAIDQADSVLKANLGPRYAETNELVQRELQRVGFKPEQIEALETAAALNGPEAVVAFRQMAIDLATARREAPNHDGGATGGDLDAAGAQSKLEELARNSDWATKALQRGTPEAIERQMLIAAANGVKLSPEEAKRLASGVARG